MDEKQAATLPYEIDKLKGYLAKMDENIKVFEAAIEREQAEQRRVREMIRVLERKRDSEE